MVIKIFIGSILLFITIVMMSCNENNDHIPNIVSQGYLSAKINGRYFYTNHVNIPVYWIQGGNIDIFGIGDNDEIMLSVEANSGNYTLGEDVCQAGYFDKTSTTHFYWSAGWTTDGTTGGQIDISTIEQNQIVAGTFSFTVKINGELISITDGAFSISNVDIGKIRLPTD